MKTTFYLVRHGETAWNAEGKLQGHSDIPLSDIGREQARNLARELAPTQFDNVYTSPLSRAQETATIIGEVLALPVNVDLGLKERNLGKLEGLSKSEMRELYPDWSTMTEEERFIDSREGTESGEHTCKRVLDTLEDIARVQEGKHVITVTHGGNIRFTLVGLGYGTLESIRGIQNCGYAVLDYEEGKFSVSSATGIKTE